MGLFLTIMRWTVAIPLYVSLRAVEPPLQGYTWNWNEDISFEWMLGKLSQGCQECKRFHMHGTSQPHTCHMTLYYISCSPDGLHHTSISQLPGTEFTVKVHSFLELIRFDATDKKWLAPAKSGHQSIQWTFELEAESWWLLASLRCLKIKGRNVSLPKF